jgi:hypothetical protein
LLDSEIYHKLFYSRLFSTAQKTSFKKVKGRPDKG